MYVHFTVIILLSQTHPQCEEVSGNSHNILGLCDVFITMDLMTEDGLNMTLVESYLTVNCENGIYAQNTDHCYSIHVVMYV